MADPPLTVELVPSSFSRRSCTFCAMSLRPTWWRPHSVFTLWANPTHALKWSGLSILEQECKLPKHGDDENYPKLEQKRPETLPLSKHIFAEGFSRSSFFSQLLEPLENTPFFLTSCDLFLVEVSGRSGLRDVFSRTPLCSYLSHVWFCLFFFFFFPRNTNTLEKAGTLLRSNPS